MKRMRNIRDEWTEEDVEFLSQQGLKAKVGMMTIPLDEDDRYYRIRQHFEERWKRFPRRYDDYFYECSDEEFENTEYYLLCSWHNCGYPQPAWDFGYKSISFNADKICKMCGCGRVQTNDLRVSKLSKHGFWTFFSWLIDEFFVSEKVYNDVFAEYGIKKRNVIKGGKVLEDVFQLVIPVIDEELNLSDREHWQCPVCGEMRYSIIHHHYPFFPLHDNPLPGIYKTKEYFSACGDGHQSQHAIIISKGVVDKLIKSKDLKKEWLIPCRHKESK